MPSHFFEQPILNSPYAYPGRHWELDPDGQPTDKITESRRRSAFITPVPKPKKRRQAGEDKQSELLFKDKEGISTEQQQYDPNTIINEIRGYVDQWRKLPNPDQWQVTPETARLLQHWRQYPFASIRPFFCQIEAVETAIWLTEVAPHQGERGRKFLDYLKSANEHANPELFRITADSTLRLTPNLVGPSIVRNEGIVGEGATLTVEHLKDMRPATILFHLSRHLLFTKYRDPGQEPRLHLFGQLKRIVRQWMDGGHLRCSGSTYPAQVLYREIADMACERIKAAVTETLKGENQIKAILDAYNPQGSTRHVNFTTSKRTLWKTAPNKCHINWIVCDSDWEAEFCRVAEAHPRVRAYAKNQGLNFEVPYLMGTTPRKYIPDFIVQIDDSSPAASPKDIRPDIIPMSPIAPIGPISPTPSQVSAKAAQPDFLNLIVEIKGFRGEDAKEKANTIRTCWIPGVNNLGKFGRWAFAEFRSVFNIDPDFDKLIQSFTLNEPPA